MLQVVMVNLGPEISILFSRSGSFVILSLRFVKIASTFVSGLDSGLITVLSSTTWGGVGALTIKLAVCDANDNARTRYGGSA
jgi:hypothetical protein